MEIKGINRNQLVNYLDRYEQAVSIAYSINGKNSLEKLGEEKIQKIREINQGKLHFTVGEDKYTTRFMLNEKKLENGQVFFNFFLNINDELVGSGSIDKLKDLLSKFGESLDPKVLGNIQEDLTSKLSEKLQALKENSGFVGKETLKYNQDGVCVSKKGKEDTIVAQIQVDYFNLLKHGQNENGYTFRNEKYIPEIVEKLTADFADGCPF